MSDTTSTKKGEVKEVKGVVAKTKAKSAKVKEAPKVKPIYLARFRAKDKATAEVMAKALSSMGDVSVSEREHGSFKYVGRLTKKA